MWRSRELRRYRRAGRTAGPAADGPCRLTTKRRLAPALRASSSASAASTWGGQRYLRKTQVDSLLGPGPRVAPLGRPMPPPLARGQREHGELSTPKLHHPLVIPVILRSPDRASPSLRVREPADTECVQASPNAEPSAARRQPEDADRSCSTASGWPSDGPPERRASRWLSLSTAALRGGSRCRPQREAARSWAR